MDESTTVDSALFTVNYNMVNPSRWCFRGVFPIETAQIWRTLLFCGHISKLLFSEWNFNVRSITTFTLLQKFTIPCICEIFLVGKILFLLNFNALTHFVFIFSAKIDYNYTLSWSILWYCDTFFLSGLNNHRLSRKCAYITEIITSCFDNLWH